MRKIIALCTAMTILCAMTTYAQNAQTTAPATPVAQKAVDKKAEKQANKIKKTDERAARKDKVMKSEGWEFFSLVFMPGAPSSYEKYAVTNGVRIGAPISAGNGMVRGVEGGVFSCLTKSVQGFQAAPFFCGTEDIEGLQFSIVNFAEVPNGVQLGLVNYAEDCGFQIGLVNMIEDGLFPFFPIVNVSF